MGRPRHSQCRYALSVTSLSIMTSHGWPDCTFASVTRFWGVPCRRALFESHIIAMFVDQDVFNSQIAIPTSAPSVEIRCAKN